MVEINDKIMDKIIRSAESTGEVALIVMVRKKVSNSKLAPEDQIPMEINDIPIDVLEVGDLRVNAG